VYKLTNILNKVVEERTFQDIVGEKNKWVELSTDEKGEIHHNLYNLISSAYDTRFEGGHPRIDNPQSIINDKDLVFWKSSDIDDDPYADVVIFGRSEHGTKLSGIGHDNSRLSKDEVMKHSAEILKQNGFWIEVSGKVAERLLQLGCSYVDNEEDVVKVLNGKPITKWLGDGWYERPVNYFKNEWNDVRQKMIIGNPNI
jgi:hypothetical protein